MVVFMPQMGIEPIPYCYDGILSPARLPIPPLRHLLIQVKTTQMRLELTTSAVTGRRSNQLSHWALFSVYILKKH